MTIDISKLTRAVFIDAHYPEWQVPGEELYYDWSAAQIVDTVANAGAQMMVFFAKDISVIATIQPRSGIAIATSTTTSPARSLTKHASTIFPSSSTTPLSPTTMSRGHTRNGATRIPPS